MKCNVINTPQLDNSVELTSFKNGKFAVKYGKQYTSNLNHYEASLELGSCIMHSLQCAGNMED